MAEPTSSGTEGYALGTAIVAIIMTLAQTIRTLGGRKPAPSHAPAPSPDTLTDAVREISDASSARMAHEIVSELKANAAEIAISVRQELIATERRSDALAREMAANTQLMLALQQQQTRLLERMETGQATEIGLLKQIAAQRGEG